MHAGLFTVYCERLYSHVECTEELVLKVKLVKVLTCYYWIFCFVNCKIYIDEPRIRLEMHSATSGQLPSGIS